MLTWVAWRRLSSSQGYNMYYYLQIILVFPAFFSGVSKEDEYLVGHWNHICSFCERTRRLEAKFCTYGIKFGYGRRKMARFRQLLRHRYAYPYKKHIIMGTSMDTWPRRSTRARETRSWGRTQNYIWKWKNKIRYRVLVTLASILKFPEWQYYGGSHLVYMWLNLTIVRNQVLSRE